MFERFVDSSRQVVVLAQEEVRTADADHIGTEHLLLALAGEPSAPPAARCAAWGWTSPRCARTPGASPARVSSIRRAGAARHRPRRGPPAHRGRLRAGGARAPPPTGRRRRADPVHADRQEDARARAPPRRVAGRQVHRHPAHPARRPPGRRRGRDGAAARAGPLRGRGAHRAARRARAGKRDRLVSRVVSSVAVCGMHGRVWRPTASRHVLDVHARPPVAARRGQAPADCQRNCDSGH